MPPTCWHIYQGPPVESVTLPPVRTQAYHGGTVVNKRSARQRAFDTATPDRLEFRALLDRQLQSPYS